MNTEGKKYPRIFSISTVGIRNHNNCDFLIHPIRTDFTGDGGTGKSLIGADLPQLILTAGNSYKSATKSDKPREYNELPLNNLGYAFLNIEKEHNKFLVIGVMIKKSPKALYPFIISSEIGLSASDDAKISKIKLFDKIVRFKDFIVNNEIPTIENAKKHLEKQGLFLKDFYHKSKDYHKILFDNKILHLDISSDDKLQKQYANTLQALSRGDSIETKGMKFKKFLFQYEDDIAKKFSDQSKEIENNQKVYQNDWRTHNALLKKKNYLIKLVSLKKNKVEAFEMRLNYETTYYHQQQEKKQIELKKLIEQFYQTELELLIINQSKLNLEKNGLIEKTNKDVADLSVANTKHNEATINLAAIETELNNIEEIVKAVDVELGFLKAINDKVQKVSNWLKVYNTIQKTREKFTQQNNIKIQTEKLKQLNTFLNENKLLPSFESSLFTKSVKEAVIHYSTEKIRIEDEIKNIKKLKEIFNNQNPVSFAGYVLKNSISLNEIQEALLFEFAVNPTKFDETENYILDPKLFLENFKNGEKTANGFVINLSGLHYHINSRQNYIFSDTKKLKLELEKIGNDYNEAIKKLENQLAEIGKYDLLTDKFKYSEEHLLAYKNREEINQFVIDPNLNITDEDLNIAILEYENNLALDEADKIHILFKAKQKEYENKLGLKNTSDTRKTAFLLEQATQKEKIDKLEPEIERQNKRLEFIENVELSAIDVKVIGWENDIKNPLKINLEAIKKRLQFKYQNELDSNNLTEETIKLSKDIGGIEQEIKNINQILPHTIDSCTKKKEEYISHFKVEFNPDSLIETVSLEKVTALKSSQESTERSYTDKYNDLLENEEMKEFLKDSVEIKEHNYDLKTIINVLIPKAIITDIDNPENSLENDIENQLAELQRKLQELNKEEASKIYNTIKELKIRVDKQIEFIEKAQAVLKDFKLSSHNRVKIQFNLSDDFKIDWIEKFKKDVQSVNFTDSLFGEKDKVTAQELLEKTFKKYCPNKFDAKANEILNPFNYYDVSAIIVDPFDVESPGSAGQNYGKLALLCIITLSINEGRLKNTFDKIGEGIRILPIDEVGGLGSNFDMLYDIAQKLDYQIFTMTIKSQDLDFEDGKQICYEFIPNSNPEFANINEGVQATFSKSGLIDDINTHFEDNIFKIELDR
jgi:exonuclease SbcC